MKTITYRKFDERGHFKCEVVGTTKRTVRESIRVLVKAGFRPMGSKDSKLPKCWTNDKGINAYIL